MRLALPVLEPFLAENVAKEVRKDALVIQRAALGPAPGAVDELLASARGIDREFLARLPVRIEIPYARIEPLRRRRIEIGLDSARCILEAWGQGKRLREALSPGELESRLLAMLKLYAEETRVLSHAVRLPALLEPMRERVAQRLEEAMVKAAHALAHAAGQKR